MARERKLNLSNSQISLLKNNANNNSNETAKKFCMVILDYYYGYSVEEIMDLYEISRRTLYSYVNKWNTGRGVSFIRKLERKRITNISKLQTYSLKIANEFYVAPFKTFKEATLRIEQLTGIKRSETQIRTFLRKTLRFRKNREEGYYTHYKPDKRLLNELKISSLDIFKDDIINFFDKNPTEEIYIAVNRICREYPILDIYRDDLKIFFKKNCGL